MATTWYIGRDRQKLGPFTIAEVQQLASLGVVRKTEFLLAEGSQHWVAAASIHGLFPESSRRRYWVSFAGQVVGPFDANTIRSSVMNGQLPVDAHVCPEGTTQWEPMMRMTKFHDVVQSRRESGTAVLSKEEAELHLAGKKGDSIARILSTLMDLRRRAADNASLLDIIDKNIHALLELREKSNVTLSSEETSTRLPSSRETKRDPRP